MINAVRFDRTLPGYRYGGRYEIKRFEDNSPWFYEDVDESNHTHSKAMYTFEITDKETRKTVSFNNTGVFYKYLNHRPDKGDVDFNIDIIKKNNPNLEITYKRNALKGPYRILDLEEDKTFFVPSIVLAAKITDINRNEIRSDLSI